MGSNGDPGDTGRSSAGRRYNENDRSSNPLETKLIREELRRWRNSKGQIRRNQLDTAKGIQKWIFTCGDRISSSYAGGGAELSCCLRGYRLLGACWGPMGWHRCPHVPPTAPRGCWGVCWGGPFLASGHLCPVLFFPKLCVQGPALLGLTLLFMLTIYVALNLETLQ